MNIGHLLAIGTLAAALCASSTAQDADAAGFRAYMTLPARQKMVQCFAPDRFGPEWKERKRLIMAMFDDGLLPYLKLDAELDGSCFGQFTQYTTAPHLIGALFCLEYDCDVAARPKAEPWMLDWYPEKDAPTRLSLWAKHYSGFETLLKSFRGLLLSCGANIDGLAVRMDAARDALRAKGLRVRSVSQEPFRDVPSDHWASRAVHALRAKWILSGYPDGRFRG